jgi:uncharacterized RDD family membrane protein YckC
VAKLIINPTSSSRREVPLGRTLLSIGRDPSNDLVLPDALVSRRHAVIECRGDQYILRDCNSSNGSLVNGDRVSELTLKDGDLLAIGTARLLFRGTIEVEDAAAKVVPHPSAPRLQCPACKADHRKGDLYCRQCGQALPVPPAHVTCTACGVNVPLPAKFCNNCGTALPTMGAPLEPTRPRPLPSLAEPVASPPAPAIPAPVPESLPTRKPETLGDVPLSKEPSSSRDDDFPELELCSPSPIRSGAQAAPKIVPPPLAPPRSRNPTPIASPRPEMPPRAVPATPARREPEPGGFGPRLLAGVMDAVLVGVGQALMVVPVALFVSRRMDASTLPTDPGFVPILLSVTLMVGAALLGAGYYIYFWGVRGATPGKRAAGLVVEGTDGTMPIGVGRAVLRLLGYVLSATLLGIGFFMIAFGGNGLHDKLASTRVVRREGA